MNFQILTLGFLLALSPLARAAPGDAKACDQKNSAAYAVCFAPCPTPNGLCQIRCHKLWQTANATCPGVANAAEKRIQALTSAERKKVGIKYLIWDNRLGAAAQRHAANMAAQQKADHVLDGLDFADRAKAEGFAFSRTTENVYYGWGDTFTTPEAAVTWWMNSPGHRANILDARVTHLGVGIRQGGDGKWYFAQSLAAP